ncbi:MAG: SpoIIE family protein phosphatase [Victivallales bacterium]|jgi:sigma-B regulation protein RsbU (phosphoserine phosphatase)|nr:SpoIIE family protein phosphatase [Victivallales bacterium]
MIAGIIVFLAVLILPLGLLATYYFRRSNALERALDRANERRREITKFLSRFSSGLQEEDGVEGAMHSAARHVAEQTDAESVAIYEVFGSELRIIGVFGNYPLIHSSNQLLFARHHHLFEALRREEIPLGKGFLGGLAITRESELIPDAAADSRFVEYPDFANFGSIMAIPLLREGILVGVVCAAGNQLRSNTSFSEAQFERLKLLSGQILMVQNLVKVYSEISKRERIDQELDFARHLQQSLLPPAFPAWDQFSINAYTRSAKEVNGDFYDFVEIDDNRLLIIIGDASGKGIPACMLTAMTRSYARCFAAAGSFTTLTDFLQKINDKLFLDTDADRFITLGCCLLDRQNSLLEFARAGHTDLISFVHDHIRTFSPAGTGLGILPNEFATFETICLAIEPGTSVMMYSDGLSEALNKDEEEFGLTRLSEVFKNSCEVGGAPQGIIDRVVDAVVTYEVEQNDDQTIVLIRHTGKA